VLIIEQNIAAFSDFTILGVENIAFDIHYAAKLLHENLP
jgi:hypothetical protein